LADADSVNALANGLSVDFFTSGLFSPSFASSFLSSALPGGGGPVCDPHHHTPLPLSHRSPPAGAYKGRRVSTHSTPRNAQASDRT
jgi:hypothetical protein